MIFELWFVFSLLIGFAVAFGIGIAIGTFFEWRRWPRWLAFVISVPSCAMLGSLTFRVSWFVFTGEWP